VPVLRYAGDNVIVVGLGKSGLTSAAALQNGGAHVRVWDDNRAVREAAAKNGFRLMSDADRNLLGVRALVWSPGVPHTWPKSHALAVTAKAANVPLICDVDLLLQSQFEAAVVAITGTNGKSTTTALTAHLFRNAGRKAAVGGNLGIPALDLEPLGLDGVYVLELSSYQLELMPHLACETAVLLNITPDHLDRHGGMDGYIAAKKRVFAHQRYPRAAIVGVDDPITRGVYDVLLRDGIHRVIPISGQGPIPRGVYVENGWLTDASEGAPVRIIQMHEVPRLPGTHNWQNAAAAAAAARRHGITHADIAAGLKSFTGLAHRQEVVAVVDGVAFVNDSKATNADATEKALRCYAPIYWIAGGRAKEGGIASLKPLFPRIRHAFLIGEAADDFADVLEGHVPTTLYEDLESAIEEAGEMALKEKRPGATVLLSPACASFDMFKSFEARGDLFRNEVNALWPAKPPAKSPAKLPVKSARKKP
jgi:UDP-N-acetylmuramoylalanine--D-glutamate ligase